MLELYILQNKKLKVLKSNQLHAPITCLSVIDELMIESYEQMIWIIIVKNETKSYKPTEFHSENNNLRVVRGITRKSQIIIAHSKSMLCDKVPDEYYDIKIIIW